MHNPYMSWKKTAATAILGAFVIAASARPARSQEPGCPAQPEKKVKDMAEYEMFNQAIKDASDPAKEIPDLDTWAQKYPDSEYKDDRAYMYMQAYSKLKPPKPEKVLDFGGLLMSKDLKCIFSKQPQNVVSILFLVSQSFVQLTTLPTADQVALAARAAGQLADYAKSYFIPANKPASTSDADWNQARAQVETVANATLLRVAAVPGNAAAANNDCPGAETAFAKALGDYPEAPGSADVAYNLGRALICQQAAKPEKVPQALYEIARSVGQDPNKGGLDPQTRAKIDAYLKTVYTQYHGSDEGLDQLKQQAAASPFPPQGFAIKTAAELGAEQQQQFAQSHPQLAMWKGIKDQLVAQGDQYFEANLKNAAVPKLRGTLVEGKPECRSKELLVAVPMPDQQGPPVPEITLKLETPLTGKPEAGAEIEWEGVPSAFTATPFMLTMDTENAKISNLQVTPCAAGKKTPPPKKK